MLGPFHLGHKLLKLANAQELGHHDSASVESLNRLE